MVRAVKLLIDRSSHSIDIRSYDGVDYGEARTHYIRTYPLVDASVLAPIISKDIEDIFDKIIRTIMRIYEGSPEYRNIVDTLQDLIESDIEPINSDQMIEIELPKTTYYMRRYIREFIGDRSKRDTRIAGFSVKASLKDLIVAFKEIPNDFKMLSKESMELLRKVGRYVPIQDHVYVRLSGDIGYTKQYISEYLIDNQHPMAPGYFVGCFGKESELMSFDDSLNYEPFIDRVYSALEEVRENNLPRIYRELFRRKMDIASYVSPYDSLYLHVGDRVLVPPMKEETFYLNKDYEMFANLPDKFLLDGNIIVKEGAATGAKPVRTPIPIDMDFMSLGEIIWRARVSTAGFVLEAKNLFGVNMEYIQDNHTSRFETSKTLSKLVSTTSVDQIYRALSRTIPSLSTKQNFSNLLRTILTTDLDESVYSYLLVGMRQEFGNDVGADNLFNLLESTLFGIALGVRSKEA